MVGKQVGETEYMLSLVPLGGYVKMLGEDDAEDPSAVADPARSFAHQPLYKRFAIVFAGPFFEHFLLVGLSSWSSRRSTASLCRRSQPRVGGLIHGLPAEKAGLVSNDRILSVNGESIGGWDQLVDHTVNSQGNPMALEGAARRFVRRM